MEGAFQVSEFKYNVAGNRFLFIWKNEEKHIKGNTYFSDDCRTQSVYLRRLVQTLGKINDYIGDRYRHFSVLLSEIRLSSRFFPSKSLLTTGDSFCCRRLFIFFPLFVRKFYKPGVLKFVLSRSLFLLLNVRKEIQFYRGKKIEIKTPFEY